MSQVMKVFSEIDQFFQDNGDFRVKSWLLMSSIFPTLFICGIYLFLIKIYLPNCMQQRKSPIELGKLMVVYNFLQVIASIWLFYEFMVSGWWREYDFKCQLVDQTPFGKPLRMAEAAWWYYMIKYTEFLDTIFFLLRKKNHQVSFLHVFHHGTMPFWSKLQTFKNLTAVLKYYQISRLACCSARSRWFLHIFYGDK